MSSEALIKPQPGIVNVWLLFLSFFLINILHTTPLWPNCQHTCRVPISCKQTQEEPFPADRRSHPAFGSRWGLCIWQTFKATSDMQVCPSFVLYFLCTFILISADVAWLTEVRYWNIKRTFFPFAVSANQLFICIPYDDISNTLMCLVLITDRLKKVNIQNLYQVAALHFF